MKTYIFPAEVLVLPSSSAQNLEGSLSMATSRASTFLPLNFVEELTQMFVAQSGCLWPSDSLQTSVTFYDLMPQTSRQSVRQSCPRLRTPRVLGFLIPGSSKWWCRLKAAWTWKKVRDSYFWLTKETSRRSGKLLTFPHFFFFITIVVF